MILTPLRQARRLLSRLYLPLSRRAVLAAACVAGVAGAQADIIGAEYSEPTTRYAHGVLGDAIEYGALILRTDQITGSDTLIRLPQDRVFEDVAPRLADLDGDGDLEVVVVESQTQTGAQLAIYDETGKIAATPHIGTRNRWLAPIGATDLDGDGHVEIAYIDRPHLAKTLRVWRFRDGALHPVADLAGLTNHRIGEDYISGGIRTCANRPEMVVASANWSRLLAVTLNGDGRMSAVDIGPHTGRGSFDQAMSCP